MSESTETEPMIGTQRDNPENISILIHNLTRFKAQYQFIGKDWSTPCAKHNYLLEPLTKCAVTIPPGCDHISVYLMYPYDIKEIFESMYFTVNSKDNRDVCYILRSDRKSWTRLDKTSIPWIMYTKCVNRRKLSVVNQSDQIVSVITMRDTQVVLPKSFMKFNSFVDLATHLGTELDIKKAIIDCQEKNGPVLQKMYCEDGLIFECEDDEQTESVKVTVKNEMGG